jgi:hypothetical protein
VQLGKRKSIFPKDFETLSTDLKEVEHAAKVFLSAISCGIIHTHTEFFQGCISALSPMQNAVELLVKRTNVNYEIVTVHKAHSRLHKVCV